MVYFAVTTDPDVMMQAVHRNFFQNTKPAVSCDPSHNHSDREQQTLRHYLAAPEEQLRFGVTLPREQQRLMPPRIKHMLDRIREFLSDRDALVENIDDAPDLERILKTKLAVRTTGLFVPQLSSRVSAA